MHEKKYDNHRQPFRFPNPVQRSPRRAKVFLDFEVAREQSLLAASDHRKVGLP